MPRIGGSLAVALVALCVVVQCRDKTEKPAKLPLLDRHTARMPHTRFAAHLHERIAPDGNLIYCGTFQLAWNALVELSGEPLGFEPELELARQLNRGGFDRGDVDPEAVTVKVERAPSRRRVSIKTTLEKNLRFAQPFTRTKDPGRDDVQARGFRAGEERSGGSGASGPSGGRGAP
jgi:hypothetical protein